MKVKAGRLIMTNNYTQFVEEFKRFHEELNLRRKSGENDYNPLLVIRSSSDEVGLHSKILHSLLDLKGRHYQDELFLGLFLEVAGLTSWFGELSGARVERESNHIDLYITNGLRHIIVENKIYAGDGKKQIERYIHALTHLHQEPLTPPTEAESYAESSSQNIDYSDIAVIYLSRYGTKPSDDSLGSWKVGSKEDSTQAGKWLISGDDKVEFRTLSYKGDILEWLRQCREKVSNIINLSTALGFYEDAVRQITNQKENTMSIEKFLDSEEKYKIAFEIIDNRQNIERAYLKHLLSRDEALRGWECAEHNVATYLCHKNYVEQMFKYTLCVYRHDWKTTYCGVRLIIDDCKYNNKDGYIKIAQVIASQLNAKLHTNIIKDCWWLKLPYREGWDYQTKIFDEILHSQESLALIDKVNLYLQKELNKVDSTIAHLANDLIKQKESV